MKIYTYSVGGRPTLQIEGEDRAHNVLTSQGDYELSAYSPYLKIEVYNPSTEEEGEGTFEVLENYTKNPIYEYDGELNRREYIFYVTLYDKMPLDDEYKNYDKAQVTVKIPAPVISYVAVQDCKERISTSDSPEEYEFASIEGKAIAYIYIKAGVRVEKIEFYASTEGEDFEANDDTYIKAIYPSEDTSSYSQEYYKISVDITSEIDWYQDYYFKFIAYDEIGPSNVVTTYGYICGAEESNSCVTLTCIDFIIDKGAGNGYTTIEENTCFSYFPSEYPIFIDSFLLTDWYTAYYELSAYSKDGTYYREYVIAGNTLGEYANTSVGGTHLEIYNSVIYANVSHKVLGNKVYLLIHVTGPEFEAKMKEGSLTSLSWPSLQERIHEYNLQEEKDQNLENEIKTPYERFLENWEFGRSSVCDVAFNLGTKTAFYAYNEFETFSIYTLNNEEGQEALKDTRILIGCRYKSTSGTYRFVTKLISNPVEQIVSEEYDSSEYNDTNKEIIPTYQYIENKYTFERFTEDYFGEDDASKQVVIPSEWSSDFVGETIYSLIPSEDRNKIFIKFQKIKEDEDGKITYTTLDEQPKFWQSSMQGGNTGFSDKSISYSKVLEKAGVLLAGQFKFIVEHPDTTAPDEEVFYNTAIASSISAITYSQFPTTYAFPARGVRPPQKDYKSKFEGELLTSLSEDIFENGWLMLGRINDQDTSQVKTMSFIVPDEEAQEDAVDRRIRLEFHYRDADTHDTCYWCTSGYGQAETKELDGVTYYAVKFSDIDIPYNNDSQGGWIVYAIDENDNTTPFKVCISNGIITVDHVYKNSNSKYLSDYSKKKKELEAKGSDVSKGIYLSYSYADQNLPLYEPEHTRKLLIVGEWFGLYNLDSYKYCNITYTKVKYGISRDDVFECYIGAKLVGLWMELEPYWNFKNTVEIKGFRKTY
jgi:hypothetical protein